MNQQRYAELLGFIKFGFPMGYLGHVSKYDDMYNHSSAAQHASHIDSFLSKEIALGGIVGPMTEKPFEPWIHLSPWMTRPKRDSDDRRVISDLTFPPEHSVNAFILKNAVWGIPRQHSLPTVTEFMESKTHG